MTIDEMIAKVEGKRCRIETTDGSVRYEVIHGIGRRSIKFGSNKVRYPTTLFFDEYEGDGVDIPILQSIRIDESGES